MRCNGSIHRAGDRWLVSNQPQSNVFGHGTGYFGRLTGTWRMDHAASFKHILSGSSPPFRSSQKNRPWKPSLGTPFHNIYLRSGAGFSQYLAQDMDHTHQHAIPKPVCQLAQPAVQCILSDFGLGVIIFLKF